MVDSRARGGYSGSQSLQVIREMIPILFELSPCNGSLLRPIDTDIEHDAQLYLSQIRYIE